MATTKSTLPPELQAQIAPAPVTRLAPGKAFGADDLSNWSKRRTVGKACVFDQAGSRSKRSAPRSSAGEPADG
jgi:hypothetical protein